VSKSLAQTATQLLQYHLCQLRFTDSTIKIMQQDRILWTATFTECMVEKSMPHSFLLPITACGWPPMAWMLRADYTDRQKAQSHKSASFPYKRILLKFELKPSV